MGCNDDIVKCLVFWVNFVLALIGVSILSVGIIYKITLEELYNAIPKDYQDIVVVPVLIIPIGTSLIALAVIGCYGSLTEKRRFITSHCIILLCIFIIQVAVGINSFYVVRETEDFSNKLNNSMRNVFNRYGEAESKGVVDLIQHQLACCGLNGSSYWEKAPKSCFDLETEIIYDRKCPPLLQQYLTKSLHVVGIVTLAFSLTELIGAFISFYYLLYLKGRYARFVFIKTYHVDNDIL